MVLLERTTNIFNRRAGAVRWDEQSWQVKTLVVLPGFYIFGALVVAVLCSIALARSSGRRAPFAVLLLAIIFFLLTEAATLAYSLLWFLPDALQSPTSHRTTFSISAITITLDHFASTFTLLALVLWISRRRRALVAALRQQPNINILRKAFITILFILMFVNGLVIGALSGTTSVSFWEAKLDSAELEARLAALKALNILTVAFDAFALIYITVAVAVLRKEMASVGQRDKPTNTVARVALPLSYIIWANYTFNVIWSHVGVEISQERNYTWNAIARIVIGVMPLVIFFTLSIRGIRTATWDTLGEVSTQAEQRGKYTPIERQTFQQPPTVFQDPYLAQPTQHSRASSSSTAYLPTSDPSSVFLNYDQKKDEKSLETVELTARAPSSQYSSPPSYRS